MQFRQKLANFAVYVARHFFDGITSYDLESMTERKWLRRILFLETVAGKALLGLEDKSQILLPPQLRFSSKLDAKYRCFCQHSPYQMHAYICVYMHMKQHAC